MTGTLHIPTLIERLAAAESISPAVGLALLAVFAGIGFKISAVPFHYWCPDVFQGASLPVATWLSVPSKAAGLILLLRIVYLFAGAEAAGTAAYADTLLPMISYGIGFFAILTCTFANLAAYRQTNIRRMLAYSSIAHAGYMLMAGAIVVQVDGYASAMSAVVAYVFIYLFMNLGAFMTVGLVAADTGSEEMPAFTGLVWRDPIVAIGMLCCLISLVGLPPFGGFFVKWWLLTALSHAAQQLDNAFLWVLVVVAALNTAISLYYYARVVWQMFFVRAEGGPLAGPAGGKAVVATCAVVLLITGTVAISPIKNRADAYVAGMFGSPESTGLAAERIERPVAVLADERAKQSPVAAVATP
jgi:NADH-quinone oxidoreductase subunit N